MPLVEGVYGGGTYTPPKPYRPISGPVPATPPVGTAAPAGSSIPGAGVYLQRQGLAEKAYQDAVANLNRQKQQTMSQYGFLEGGGVDPNNQYGLFQQMMRGQAQGSEQAENATRSRGFAGFGGLGGRKLADLNYQQGAQRLDLQRGYDDSLYQVQQGLLGAEGAKSSALLDAQQEAAMAALQAGNFTPAVPPVLPGKAQAKAAIVNNVVKNVVKKAKKGRKR